jgi:hypothetical protein
MKKELKEPQIPLPGLPDDNADLPEHGQNGRSERIAERTRLQLENDRRAAEDTDDDDDIIEFKKEGALLAMMHAVARRLASTTRDDNLSAVTDEVKPAVILSTMARMKLFLMAGRKHGIRHNVKAPKARSPHPVAAGIAAHIPTTLSKRAGKSGNAQRRSKLSNIKASQAASFIPSSAAPNPPGYDPTFEVDG